MELRQLRYFAAVADMLNFSRASESLYVSQSALSKQIAELEQELGVVLFQRDKRNVELTPAGRLLLPEAKGILLQTDKLAPLLRYEAEENQRESSIYIGVESRADTDLVVHGALTQAVFQQRKKNPGLRAIFWQEEFQDLKKALLEDTLDLGIFLHSADTLGEGLTCHTLCQDEMVLVFASDQPWADTRENILELLERRGLILLEKESRGMSQILKILSNIGSAPQIRFSSDRTAMTLTMESGESTTILPLSIARRLVSPHLHMLHFGDPAALLHLLVAWHTGTCHTLARQVVESTLAQIGCGEQRM